ncbi:MAG TPA: hypothetical protein VF269_07775 [Rhodanobacteraceae bacterium]
MQTVAIGRQVDACPGNAICLKAQAKPPPAGAVGVQPQIKPFAFGEPPALGPGRAFLIAVPVSDMAVTLFADNPVFVIVTASYRRIACNAWSWTVSAKEKAGTLVFAWVSGLCWMPLDGVMGWRLSHHALKTLWDAAS